MHVRQFLMVGALLVVSGLAAPLSAAQTPAAAPAPSQTIGTSAPAPDPRKTSVLSFETNLRFAIELAGQRMAERALEIAPVKLVPSKLAMVRGVPLEGFGFHFDVVVPDINPSGLAALEMVLNNQEERFLAPTRQVAQGGGEKVAALLVTPDAVGRAPVVATLNAMYTSFVKDALTDVILDTAGVLTIADGDKLAVTASGEDVVNNQLDRLKNRKLILTIKGADLNEFRTGKITRDQAKERIAVQAF